MSLQTIPPALLILYIILLTVAFHKLVFEIRLRFTAKFCWSLVLALFPVIGVLLFYAMVKADKDELSVYVPSFRQRAVRAFLIALMMLLIMAAAFLVISYQAKG